MKVRFVFALLPFFLVSFLIVQPGAAQTTADAKSIYDFQNEVTIDFLRSHLSALAADSMEGRETGMEGQKKAARYLAKQYRSLGLDPAAGDQSYLQHFDLVANRADSTIFELYKTGDDSILIDRSVASSGSAAKFIRAFGGFSKLDGEIIFAGFGVNDPAHAVSHLEGMDLAGKWVMVFREIPNVVDGDTLIDPGIDFRSRFSMILNQNNAAGILLIPSMGSKEFEQTAEQRTAYYSSLTGMSLKYRSNGQGPGGYPLGYNLVHPELAAQILSLDTGVKGLAELKNELIENITGFKPRSTGYGLKHTPYTSQETIVSENVAAFLEGQDPELKDEVVVLTSHYDHLGVGQPDSTGDRIYNGADDDGSGTVALLNVAHALKEAKLNGQGPRRSVLFLHVSGEEKGLLGSRFYSDHPLYPIDRTVANINIDMIGRLDEAHKEQGVADYSYIIGSDIISSDMDSLLKAANRKSGNIEFDMKYNDLKDPNQFYRRSDHWNFGRLGVPFVFFFTGVHEDYHRPSDEIEKIQFEKMAKIVRTIYATTVEVANAESPPEVDNQAFIKITQEN